ncbi:MAG: hypothetical protein K0U98_21570 [Deltaproteobacteria bacterium]|nr:hypothetical protein [Deltaproteobacteria bacterium]
MTRNTLHQPPTTQNKRTFGEYGPWIAFIAAAALLLGSGTVALAGAAKDITRAGVLIGADDDNMDNPVIQPADSQIDQSLNNGDVLIGRDGPDVLIGLLGADLLEGGEDDDILIGGPEAFVAPNKDIILGGSGNDINIWAPGDGSDAFLGGPGDRDAMVFGVLDRVDGIPTLTPSPGRLRTGIPTAEVTNMPGFCVLEAASRRETGFDYLVRFFTFSDGLLKVTVRLRDVEQLFCNGPDGGTITYADLTQKNPILEVVSLQEVVEANPLVGQIIR